MSKNSPSGHVPAYMDSCSKCPRQKHWYSQSVQDRVYFSKTFLFVHRTDHFWDVFSATQLVTDIKDLCSDGFGCFCPRSGPRVSKSCKYIGWLTNLCPLFRWSNPGQRDRAGTFTDHGRRAIWSSDNYRPDGGGGENQCSEIWLNFKSRIVGYSRSHRALIKLSITFV